MTDKLIAQMNTKVNVVRIADESVDKLKTSWLHVHINYKHNYYAQLYLPRLVRVATRLIIHRPLDNGMLFFLNVFKSSLCICVCCSCVIVLHPAIETKQTELVNSTSQKQYFNFIITQ